HRKAQGERSPPGGRARALPGRPLARGDVPGGYAVECRLKYTLMRQWKCYAMEALELKLSEKGISVGPYTHNLEVSLRHGVGWERLQEQKALWNNFKTTVNPWRPAWRYDPDLSTQIRAQDFLGAVEEMLEWIEHNL